MDLEHSDVRDVVLRLKERANSLTQDLSALTTTLETTISVSPRARRFASHISYLDFAGKVADASIGRRQENPSQSFNGQSEKRKSDFLNSRICKCQKRCFQSPQKRYKCTLCGVVSLTSDCTGETTFGHLKSRIRHAEEVSRDRAARAERAEVLAAVYRAHANIAEQKARDSMIRVDLTERERDAERAVAAARARERESVVARLQRERDSARLALARAERVLANFGEFPGFLAELHRSRDELRSHLSSFVCTASSRTVSKTYRIDERTQHYPKNADCMENSLYIPTFEDIHAHRVASAETKAAKSSFESPIALRADSIDLFAKMKIGNENEYGLDVNLCLSINRETVSFTTRKRQNRRLPPKKCAVVCKKLFDGFEAGLFEYSPHS